jgi:BTB/POZ domain/WD domain, G-beta repeat
MPSKRARKVASRVVKYDSITEELEGVTVQVEDTMKSLQNLLDSITRRTAELDEQEKRAEAMEALMKANRDKVASIIKLNLGGKIFSVYKSILLKVGGTYFVGMLSSSMFQPDFEGAYYIDCSSEGFERILAYLDTGELSFKGLNEYEVDCVYANLDYFNIPYERRWDYNAATLIEGLQLQNIIQLQDGRLCGSYEDNDIFSMSIYNMDTNSIELTLNGHTAYIPCMIQLEDGRLSSCSYDHTIKLWNIESGLTVLTIYGHQNDVNCIIQLLDGRICSCSEDGEIKLWSKDNGVCELTIDFGFFVRCITQLKNGQLCSGDNAGAILLWNITTGACEKDLCEHDGGVNRIILNHNDSKLYSCSGDTFIKVWNTSNGVCDRTLEGHDTCVYSIVLLGYGRLCSMSSDGCAKIWNLETGVCEHTMNHDIDADDDEANESYNVSTIQLQDGRLLSCCNERVFLWN